MASELPQNSAQLSPADNWPLASGRREGGIKLIEELWRSLSLDGGVKKVTTSCSAHKARYKRTMR